MSLRIVRSSPVDPLTVKGTALKCDRCPNVAYIQFRPGLSWEERQNEIDKALAEHRRLTCTGGEANLRRVYTITHPR